MNYLLTLLLLLLLLLYDHLVWLVCTSVSHIVGRAPLPRSWERAMQSLEGVRMTPWNSYTVVLFTASGEREIVSFSMEGALQKIIEKHWYTHCDHYDLIDD